MSFRYFHSFRDFNDSAEEVIAPPSGQNDTYVEIWDYGVIYALTKRLSLSAELPIQNGSRRNKFEHDFKNFHTSRAFGAGDIRLAASYWILDPDKYRHYNVSVGLGVKVPSGQDDITDTFLRQGGRTAERPVDSAIQPGDGGWGIILAINSFAEVYKNGFLFFQGTYLSNPRETNHVQVSYGDQPALTFSDPGEKFNSVPDQWLVRSGFTTAIWPQYGLSGSIGVRWEGIPSHDVIGGSDFYRLPGYSVSFEPGIAISRGRNSLAITAPWAIYRIGLPSVPDVRVHSPFAGISSYADFQINMTFSHLF